MQMLGNSGSFWCMEENIVSEQVLIFLHYKGYFLIHTSNIARLEHLLCLKLV